MLLVILSFIPTIRSLNREFGFVGPSDLEIRAQKLQDTKGKKKDAAPDKRGQAIQPEVAPLDLLPSTIEGYMTQGRHKVAGERNVAEAFFQPDTEQATHITPYNCHVRVSHQPSKQKAREIIALSLKRYTVGRRQLKLGDLAVTEAYEQEKMAYYLGWTMGNYAIEIDTSFIRAKHPGYTNHLVSSGREVAISVGKLIKGRSKKQLWTK